MKPNRLALLLFPLFLWAQNLQDFEKRVTEFTLANGLHFIVLERHEAPVVSFHTYVNAGSVDDPAGETGLAHMFEHMAFKGTPRASAPATSGGEERARRSGSTSTTRSKWSGTRAPCGPEEDRGAGGEAEGRRLRRPTAMLCRTCSRGSSRRTAASDMNAGTGVDAPSTSTACRPTGSSCGFCWSRSAGPSGVPRVLQRARRGAGGTPHAHRILAPGQADGSVAGDSVRRASPIATPRGWASDIESLRPPRPGSSYKTYYVPGNIVMGIAGDVKPAEAKRLAQKYFSTLPARPIRPRSTPSSRSRTAKRRRRCSRRASRWP